VRQLKCGKAELGRVVGAIMDALPHGGVVILQGDLASGKTTLTKAAAVHLDIDEPVTSPTFSLQQQYGDQLFHYDIYNHGIEHFLALGLLAELEKPGYHFIEWGDETLTEMLTLAEIPTVVIEIEKCAPDARCYKVYHA
jgi:tRNA threonylcarbamoyladenosine biosynthesis protein TsaE